MTREKFDEYVKFVSSHLPSNLSEDLKLQIEGNIRMKLIEFRSLAVDEFCKKHDICSICITGGYMCNLDHK